MNVGRSARMTRNAFTISLSGLLVLSLSGLQTKTEASNSDFTSLTGHVPAQISSSRIIDRVQADETIGLALALPISRQAALTDYLQHLYTPGDPIFGQYMTPETFAERFGPTQADYDAVASYAEANGLHVTARHANRLVIDVEGRSADIESAFHTRLMHYQNPAGHIFRAPETDPLVPKAIAPRLSAVVGLSDEAVRRPHFRELPQNRPLPRGAKPEQTGSGPGGGLTPGDIKTAYNLSSTSLNGTGQVLALFELDGYAAGDITAYEQAYGLPNVTLQNVLIDGYNGASGSGAVEVTLDIELVLALAPGASKIMVYEGPNSDQGVIDTYNKIAVDNAAKQISTSWGLDENSNPATVRNAENLIFQQMAAQGQTIYAASGDSGAYDNGSSLSVDDPASQPYMTGVGGTTLRTAGAGGAYTSETTWNGGSISGGGGGGGSSTVWSIPSYQNGVVSTASKGSKTARNVPDVSLDSDPGTGYSIYFAGGWRIYGGTSCAAPLWAAFTALANQQRIANGTMPLGFINPLLYNIGKGSRYISDFHDIADSSTNLFYPAVTGYDDATGWGSFNGANLLLNLIAGDATSGGPSETIPAAPTGLTATAGSAQVTLAWNAVSGAATYNVYRATTAGGEGSTPVKTGLTTPAFTDTGLTNGTTYFYKVSAVNTAGESAKSSEASGTPSAAVGPQSSAVFVKTDAATQGNWKGVYGADGYRVLGDTASLPAYAGLSASGQSSWTWAGSTSDTRALQKASSSTDRVAACDYASTNFRYDLNLTDGQSHQVAFYCLDWETNARSQTIQIFDAATNTLLDSQSAASFNGGKYLVWNISGHVSIQVTNTGSPNAVVSGVFFAAAAALQIPPAPGNLKATAGNQSVTLTWDPASGAATYNVYRATTAGGEGSTPVKTGLTTPAFTDTGLTNGTTYFYKVSAVNTAGESAKSSEASGTPSAAVGPQSSAVFVKTDAATQGNWKGVYGADGYRVLGDTASLPAYAGLSASGQSSWTWAGSTSDTRALQKASSSTDRVAACDYASTNFRYDLNLTDGQSHQVAFYCLDWETNARSQTIQIFDAATNTLLDSQSAASFNGGKYLVWNISGHVSIQVTNTGSPNAVVSGVFFAAAAALQIPPAPGNLKATAGNQSVTLTWDPASGAATYNVYRATTAGGEGSTPVKTGLTTTAYSDTGLTNGTTYFYKVSAVNTAGESAKSSEASGTPSAAVGPQSSAVFVKTDAATQGNWKGVYGADGYRVLGDTASLPAYAGLSVSGQSSYTWSGSTSDVRALQKASSSTDRVAACDYSGSSFRYDLNLTDGQSHQVAFYCLDWETNARSQTIQIFDAATNTLLDSQSAASFNGGKYLVWNISGHVSIQVTNTGSPNAVISGVFFAAAGTVQIPAAPTGLTATAGSAQVTLAWNAVSGAATYNVYRATTAGGEGSTPVKTGLTTTAYSDTGLTNGTTYFYKVSAVNTAGESAKSSEASGTPSAAVGPQSSAVFVKTDAATQGNWKGVYGADGYRVLGDTASLPAYAGLSVSGQSSYTWSGSTSDVRALQKASSSTDRVAACDYSGSSFRYDLNLTDGQSHQVAFYCLDWETNARSQTIQIFDAATNTLLDSQSAASFNGGKYLVWNISGHVSIQVTNTGSPNAVVSGVFFK